MGRRTGAKQRSLKQKGLYKFMSKKRLAVLSTITDSGQPRAAFVGMALTPPLEIIFRTVKSSRKYPDLKKNPRRRLGGWLHNGSFGAI